MKGSTTAIANAVATAASTAFPPRRRTSAPTWAPRGWPAVTQARSTSSWLFVTDRREAFTARSFSHAARGPASAAAGAARSEAVTLLHRMLDELSPEQRAVFVLVELEQMSVAEAASAVSANIHTVTSRLKVARQRFEVALRRHRAADGRHP